MGETDLFETESIEPIAKWFSVSKRSKRHTVNGNATKNSFYKPIAIANVLFKV